MAIRFDISNNSISKVPDSFINTPFNVKQQQQLQKLQLITQAYIYQHYPQTKQMSDIADKEYYETILKAQNIDEVLFRQAIIQSVENIFNSASDFSTEVTRIQAVFPTVDVTIIEQLLKVAVRVAFVQKCKQVYYQYATQIESATTEAELPNLDTISFPRFPL